MLDEADPRPARVLGPGTDALSRFVWARAPLVARDMAGYALYRLARPIFGRVPAAALALRLALPAAARACVPSRMIPSL